MIQVEGTFGGGAKINGVKGEYLATANISKGDFVQLTTKGVEVPAFTEVATFDTGTITRHGVAVCVLSERQIIYTHVEGNEGVSVYAQVATYTNGAWELGEKCLLYFADTQNPDVNITRLNNNRAAIVFAGYATSSSNYVCKSAVLILETDMAGEITVAAISEDPFVLENGTSNTPLRIVSLSDTTFVTVLPLTTDYDVTGSYYRSVAISWVYDEDANAISRSLPVLIFSNTTAGVSYKGLITSLCALNENTVICPINGSINSSFAGKLIHVTGTTISTENFEVSNADYGPCCKIAENVIAQIGCRENRTEHLITYDPLTGTLTSEQYLDTEIEFHSEIVKISDDKLLSLIRSSNTSTSATLHLTLIDMAAGTETQLNTALDSSGLYEYAGTHRCDAYAGWVAIVSGMRSIIVAPCISQTTAAPYESRLDGVASKGATAGQMAEVVTP